MAAKRGGAGGEAAIDMIDRRAGRKHSPDTPHHAFRSLSPGHPGRGLTFLRRALAIYEPVTQSGQMSCRSDADCSICPNSIQRE